MFLVEHFDLHASVRLAHVRWGLLACWNFEMLFPSLPEIMQLHTLPSPSLLDATRRYRLLGLKHAATNDPLVL